LFSTTKVFIIDVALTNDIVRDGLRDALDPRQTKVCR